ncbi:hypothetical protein [Actinophytocola sp. KF-1]
MSNKGTEARRVVICGSMKNLGLMNGIAEILETSGLDVVTPEPDERTAVSAAAKRAASLRHMGQIRNQRTAAILVVNVDRPGALNYVGPNSFAEISVAFADQRRVFLLQGMPDYYADELAAWGVECLNGDLPRMVRDLGAQEELDPTRWQEVFQYS